MKDKIILSIYAISFLLLIFLAITSLCRPINKVFNKREVTVTITDKTVKNNRDESKYLIYSEDSNGKVHVFEITDSLLAFRFNSSDVYAALKVNHKYKLTISGSRNRLLSWYPNIMEYELIE